MTDRFRVAGLMYHEIADDPASSGFQGRAARRYAHTTATFARHLERIAAGPLRPSLVTALDPARPADALLLTFDDGGRSARYAAEELARRQWTGHFFIVTARLGERTFLAPADLRAIRSLGHLIGSHSHTHPNIFPNQSMDAMREEWRVSVRMLEDLLGEPCLAASVPGGDLSSLVIETAAEAGFRYLLTSEPVLHPSRCGNCWILGRLCLKAETSPAAVGRLLRFRGWGRARLDRRIKGVLRRALPWIYQRYVGYTTRSVVRSASTAPGG